MTLQRKTGKKLRKPKRNPDKARPGGAKAKTEGYIKKGPKQKRTSDEEKTNNQD